MKDPGELEKLISDHNRAFDLMFMHGVKVGAELDWPTWQMATPEERKAIQEKELKKLKEELKDL